jgi:hypothetical protein
MNIYTALVHNRNTPAKVTSIFAASYQDALFGLAMLYDFFEDVMEVTND